MSESYIRKSSIVQLVGERRILRVQNADVELGKK